MPRVGTRPSLARAAGPRPRVVRRDVHIRSLSGFPSLPAHRHPPKPPHTPATADAARCPRPSCAACPLPGSAYNRAATEAQALLARAREAAALTLTRSSSASSSSSSAGGGSGGSSGGDRVRRCMEELLAWLVGGGGASRRLLGDGHRLRCVCLSELIRRRSA